MKKNNKLIASCLIVVMLFSSVIMSGCEKREEAALDSSINADNAKYWRDILWKYRDQNDVKQILLVRYTGGCSAKAQYYQKSKYNNAWELTFESTAYVGRQGIGKVEEGDNQTPTGDFGIRPFAFGILPNPGTSLEYLDVTKDTYACDEDTELYNQIFDISKSEHKNCTGEEMFKYSPEYNYGLTMENNPNNVYPNGSNIFLHCKGAKSFTGGCVALDQKDMVTVLKTCDKNMRIVVGDD